MRVVAVVLLALVGVVAGCSSDAPVEFGTAKVSGGGLGLEVPRGRYLPAGQWPDACTLVGDEELRAILPQAKEVSRKPQALTITVIPDLITGQGGETLKIPAAGCDLWFKLPGEDKPYTNISFDITAIADPALVRKEHADARKSGGKATDLPRSWGDASCFADQESVGLSVRAACRTEHASFTLSGHSSVKELSGKGGHDASGDQVFLDKVLSQVARTLAARLG